METQLERFKRLRTQLNKDRKEFGQLLGFSTPYQRVWEIETERRPISRQIKTILDYIENALQKEKFLNKQNNGPGTINTVINGNQ